MIGALSRQSFCLPLDKKLTYGLFLLSVNTREADYTYRRDFREKEDFSGRVFVVGIESVHWKSLFSMELLFSSGKPNHLKFKSALLIEVFKEQ